MARLTAEQWEQARAEYEVRGVSLGEVARRCGVSDVAVGKRARKEGWTQGKSSDLVEKKVSAIKELCAAERQSSDLPQTIRTTIDDVVRERLEADHMLAQFDRALSVRGLAILQSVATPEEWETMTRGRRNMTPAREPAQTGQHNDYTVFLLAGTDGQNVYILDLLRARLEAPDLIQAAKAFYGKHRPNRITNPVRFAGFFVEDKVSGTGLIQTLRRETDIPDISLQRDRDKVSRVNDILPYIRAGRLWVPQQELWVEAYLGELAAFSPAMTHEHDDQVDPTCDAITELLSPGGDLLTGADWS